jgi:hypothetical protein
MTNEKLRLRMLSEDPEEAQFLDNQAREDFEELERSKEEKNEQIEILKGYLGSDFEKIKAVDEFAVLNICGAMADYALSKIANYNKL